MPTASHGICGHRRLGKSDIDCAPIPTTLRQKTTPPHRGECCPLPGSSIRGPKAFCPLTIRTVSQADAALAIVPTGQDDDGPRSRGSAGAATSGTATPKGGDGRDHRIQAGLEGTGCPPTRLDHCESLGKLPNGQPRISSPRRTGR